MDAAEVAICLAFHRETRASPQSTVITRGTDGGPCQPRVDGRESPSILVKCIGAIGRKTFCKILNRSIEPHLFAQRKYIGLEHIGPSRRG
jgi:hypothetical protein